MNSISKAAFGVLLGASALAATAGAASAAIVCNRFGECWHVRAAYAYRPEFGLAVHPNTWRWGAGERYVWREHPGRGYWRNGVWITF